MASTAKRKKDGGVRKYMVFSICLGSPRKAPTTIYMEDFK